MNGSWQQPWRATFMFPDRDVKLPIRPEGVPRSGDRVFWTSENRVVGEFMVTEVCWHVNEQQGARPHVDISLDPDDVPRETSPPANAHEALVELLKRDRPPTEAEWDAHMDGIAQLAASMDDVAVPRETSRLVRAHDAMRAAQDVLAGPTTQEEWDEYMRTIRLRADADVPRETSPGGE